MINPVNNNLPNEYRSGISKTAGTDSSEHFSLDSALNNQAMETDDNGVIYEHSEKKNQSSDTNLPHKNDTFDNSLEKAIEKQNINRENEEIFNEEIRSIWTSVKDFLGKLWGNLKAIFGNIWESKPLNEGVTPIKSSTASSDTVSSDSVSSDSVSSDSVPSDSKPSASASSDTIPAKTSEGNNSVSSIEALEKSRDIKIQEALAAGNKDEFRALLSEDGKRLPAHNTTLLTTYDSKGKLVSIDPSDENKILHGNRGVKKL